MKRYVINLAKADREKWQLSEVDKAMVKGGEKACQFIHANAEAHLVRLTSCMEWFPVACHLADKVALVVFPVLAYYTGKYHLNDTMTFLWAMAFMPIFVLSAIWGINELAAYLERRKKKLKMQCYYVKYRILKPRFYVKYRVLHIFFVSLDANWYESQKQCFETRLFTLPNPPNLSSFLDSANCLPSSLHQDKRLPGLRRFSCCCRKGTIAK